MFVSILLPGRSYGNQDSSTVPGTTLMILLPGRSCGNQSVILGLFEF